MRGVCVCVRTHIRTYIHTHSGLLLSHKKEHDSAICDNMDEPRGCYAQ